MKVFFIIFSSFITFIFLTGYIVDPYIILNHRVDRLIRNRNFYKANVITEQVLRERPCLFKKEANSKLGEIHIEAAQNALDQPNPDFQTAIAWLSELLKRSQPTGYEDEANQILQGLPIEHIEWAEEIAKKDCPRAIKEFQVIESLYQIKDIQSEARREAGFCRLKYIKDLTDKGRLEEGLEELAKIVATGNVEPVVLQDTMKIVPDVTEQAVRARIKQGQFANAFKLIDRIKKNFPYPDVANRLKKFEGKLEQEVFNTSWTDYNEIVPPVRVDQSNFDGSAKTTVVVRNDHEFFLKAVYRGPSPYEVELPPGSEKEVVLSPGEYLVAAFSPKNRKVKPYRGEFSVETGTYHQTF